MIIMSLFTFKAKYQDGNFEWSREIGSTATDKGYDIAFNAAGNLYTTRYFQASVDFNPRTALFNLRAAGSFNIFV